MLPSVGKAILLFLGVVIVLATALPPLRAEAWWVPSTSRMCSRCRIWEGWK